MKTIDKKQLEKLLGIINHAPAMRIAHFSDAGVMMSDTLSAFCEQYGYEYQLNCTTQGHYDSIATRYTDHPHSRCTSFKLNRPKYLIQAKIYDYLFVTVDVPEAMRESFLQKAHSAIKSGGLIILFLPKGDREQAANWWELLEANYYVATNTIDLFEHYDLMISKKMHGWGG